VLLDAGAGVVYAGASQDLFGQTDTSEDAMRMGVLVVLAVATVGSGCASGRHMESAALAAEGAVAARGVSPDPDGRALVRTAQMQLDVPEVADAAGTVRGIVEAAGGHVVRNTATEGNASLVLRVPAVRLDDVMAQLGTLGRVTHREETVRDVTEQVIDLDARLRNLRAVRDRLHAYLERSQSVSEIVEVERELVRVQAEIDSLEGRLNHLRSSVEMAELHLRLRRQRVLGPLGAVLAAAGWLIGKLFIIR
jgi:hypothetical protein